MNNDDVSILVKGIIETQVIQALNSAPEAIDKLVKAALSRPVDSSGKFDGYGTKMPYLDYLVGDEIRFATQNAVHKIVSEHSSTIEAKVREGLSADSVVAAITKALIGAAEDTWRINVNFTSK